MAPGERKIHWGVRVFFLLGLGVGIFGALATWFSPVAWAAAAPGGSVTANPPEMEMVGLLWWLAPLGSVLALLFAYGFYRAMLHADEGTSRMKEIAGYVRQGAYAYLKRQYKVVSLVFVVLLVIFAVLAWFGYQNPFVPVAFLTGGFFSGLCGFLGMKAATLASSRTAQGAVSSLNRGLRVAFRSGAVMGLVVVGFGLFDICMWYLILNALYDHNVWNLSLALSHKIGLLPETATSFELAALGAADQARFAQAKLVEITTTMITFGMGASTQALFARVGGGIYTKAADVGADLVGKVEAGIPEDDPRNPATIADNVGDNVGDVAGMGADLYESYCGSILATTALGASLAAGQGGGLKAVLAPMIVAGIGIMLSIAGIFMVRTREEATQRNLLNALLLGTGISSALIVAAMFLLYALGVVTLGLCGAVIAGLLAGVIIGQATELFTSDEYWPTRSISHQARTGPATTIIDGVATGMYSTGIPIVTIVVGLLCAYGFAGGFTDMSQGLYGVGFAAVGMLATLGITLATDAYGPIADNAGGNAEMSGLGEEVRQRTDALDALGNTTAATGKGFAIGSAALTALALLAAYLEEVRLWVGKLADRDPQKLYEIAASKIAFFASANKPAAAGKLEAEGWRVLNTHTAKLTDFVEAYDLTLMNPLLLCGLFLGAMMVFVFCAMTMKAVGRAAGRMVEEVRRQFREKPGIMAGTEMPDYARCVAISTAGAQREMILPASMAVAVPVLVGLLFGVPGVLGLLAGGLTCGFAFACLLNNAGGAWDNAKKYIEKAALQVDAWLPRNLLEQARKLGEDRQGRLTVVDRGEELKFRDATDERTREKLRPKAELLRAITTDLPAGPDAAAYQRIQLAFAKGSLPHKAGVVGDTVGDPFKDTSGPSLNILIKLMTMVSVVFAGLVVPLGGKLFSWLGG